MSMTCKRCGKAILNKVQFVQELAEHGIQVDPYNVDRFKASGVAIGSDPFNSFFSNAQETYNQIQKKRAFQCQSCRSTYCMECLLNYAPSHRNGGKACLACRGAFMEL